MTSQFKEIQHNLAQALFDASLAVRGMNHPTDLSAAIAIIKNALTRANDELFPQDAEIIEADLVTTPLQLTDSAGQPWPWLEGGKNECTKSSGKACPSAVERERTS